MNKEFEVVGMSCGNCVRHVTHALEGVEGVSNVEVNLENGLAKVELLKEVADATLISAIEASGYSVK